MPRLIATAPLIYADRDLRAGDIFDAAESDARVLLAIGRATEAAQPAVSDPPKDMGDIVIHTDGEPLRRRYRRRDMRAED